MFKEKPLFLTSKEKLGYIEEFIILNETNKLLKYSLSNNLEDINMAIFTRTGQNIDLGKVYWKLNPSLSIQVKYLMNKYRSAFSMTTWQEKKGKELVINMRVNDKWFITSFSEYNGTFHSSYVLNLYKLIIRFIDKLNSDDSDND